MSRCTALCIAASATSPARASLDCMSIATARIEKPRRYPNLDGHSVAAFDRFGEGYLASHLGIEMIAVSPREIIGQVRIRRELMSPNGSLHGGTLVAVADNLCGYGSIINLPQEASGFTTIELTCNFLGMASSGILRCEARPLHLGRSTHVWDAALSEAGSGRRLAMVRCTQMVLWG
jgi:1,4-dihydroxy-2-naphthoyl-CoA hydrolase